MGSDSNWLHYCAAQSTIAPERAKINPTLTIRSFRCREGIYATAGNPRKTRRIGCGHSAVEAGQGPAAMSNWPLFQFVQDLEGFDFAAFLLERRRRVLRGRLCNRLHRRPLRNGAILERFLRDARRLCGALRARWWLQPYAAYEPYFDDDRGRRRIVDDGRRWRARSPTAEPTADLTAADTAAANRRRASVRRPAAVASRALFCDCAMHNSLARARRRRPRRPSERIMAQANGPTTAGRRRPRQALDLPHLRRPFDGARVQQALSPEPRQGTDRALHRLRPADPDRLRQRSHPGARRGRQGRRRDLPHRRHAGPVRGHSARLDEHLDDHQRHRALADGPLYRGRRRAGRAAQGSFRARPRTTSSRNIWRAAPTSSRPTPRSG